jgi:pimeloyl-ACP methyl ester carboxylesterase
MQTIFLFFLMLAMLLSACSPRAASPTDPDRIDLSDCVLSAPGDSDIVDAQCGTLSVPENPDDPQSRTISLNIAVVPAIKRSPEPDPLFVLAGGPGQSITEAFPSMYGTLFRIHEQRDIVLVDQRGTGKSNPLRCIDPDEETLEHEEAIRLLKACPESLDADLHYYTTDIAMQDLDRVRSALGYSSINLYGASYGTRAALVYLKMFPDRVRSIILDAVVDPEFVIYQDSAYDGQQALELFFARCEADDACADTFPDLRTEFDALLQRVEETPVQVTIPHPITGNPLDLEIDRMLLTSIIFNTLYVPDLVALLPLAIHQAYADENYLPLVTQAYLVNAGIYDGMFYSVACTEDAPLLSTETIEQSNEDSLFAGTTETFLDVCSAWPQREPPDVVRAPVSSDVPVLMLSGEADPITPPRYAERLAESLENDLHLIFNEMGHGNSSNLCAAKIIDQFVDQASFSELETDCVAAVAPPPFFVDFSGPNP